MKPATYSGDSLETITGKIKACLSNIAGNIIEIGRQLKAAKSLVNHGAWQFWLKSNFNLTDRTARNYMRVASYFGGKTENVFRFQPAQMLELTKISAADSANFLQQLEANGSPAESLSVRDLREAIKKWNERHNPHKSSKPVVTIDAGEVVTTTTTSIAVVPARQAVQLSLFDDLPAPLTPPDFQLPAEIIEAAGRIGAPCYLIRRAGQFHFPPPSIVVAMATPLAEWLSPLVATTAALIHCRLKFSLGNGQIKMKASTILFFGNDVDAFNNVFKFFGVVLVPIVQRR